jgi:hypothetical protein
LGANNETAQLPQEGLRRMSIICGIHTSTVARHIHRTIQRYTIRKSIANNNSDTTMATENNYNGEMAPESEAPPQRKRLQVRD